VGVVDIASLMGVVEEASYLVGKASLEVDASPVEMDNHVNHQALTLDVHLLHQKTLITVAFLGVVSIQLVAFVHSLPLSLVEVAEEHLFAILQMNYILVAVVALDDDHYHPILEAFHHPHLVQYSAP
jgi:hypothetical protein